jgi:hypothetical protein
VAAAIARSAASFLIFLLSFFVMTVLATILWQTFVDGTLYNNTDSVGGYPFPADLFLRGDWPLQTVDKIVRDGDMTHPDTILRGWTELDLRLLWGTFLATTIFISIALAWLPWIKMSRAQSAK